MLWVFLSIAAAVVTYWFLVRPNKYWTKKGVKQENNSYILGDISGLLLKTESFAGTVQRLYDQFPNTRYSGFYQFTDPTLLIRDPDLIKQITVKDFDHFVDHQPFIPEDSDPLWGGNLLALTGQRWRDMRTNLSPAFTASKMKIMFGLISQSGKQFVDYISKKKEDVVTLEMKDTFSRFAADVIGNTAFGVETDSLKDRDNEFYLMGKNVTDFSSFWTILKIFAYNIMPQVYKFFKIPLFSKKERDFFNRLVKNNIESREKHHIVRPDMINLLLEARKNNMKFENGELKKHKTEVTDQAITSQALIFFFAGFETISSLMTFMSYELAINPEVQQKLIEEVDEAWKACNGELTYEVIQNMKYIDMVVSESLRKWPSAISSDRICTKPYTIEPKYPDETPLHIEKDTAIWIPTWAIHRDPKYFPDPDRFDPERFSDENKDNIVPYSYLPFSVGPRNCIGSRFALLEIKTLFFYVLRYFEIVPVKKTKVPMVLKTHINLAAEGGMWLGFRKRVTA